MYRMMGWLAAGTVMVMTEWLFKCGKGSIENNMKESRDRGIYPTSPRRSAGEPSASVPQVVSTAFLERCMALSGSGCHACGVKCIHVKRNTLLVSPKHRMEVE